MKLWGLCVVLLCLHCASRDEDKTPEELRQRVRDDGTYCCTHDGAPSSPACETPTKRGSVYLEDFSAVDASGRGDACGWIWEGK